MRWYRGPWHVGVFVIAMLSCGVSVAFGQTEGVGQLTARIGVIEGPDEQVFGKISGALVMPRGEIVVMDEQLGELRLFDAQGQFLDAVGRQGAGPEEFGAGALSLALADDGRILVADSRNLRVATLRIESERLRFSGTFRLAFAPLDICAIGTRTFVFTTVGDHLIREVSQDGGVVQEFAEREKPTGRLAAQLGDADHFLNHGRLACDTGSETIVVVHTFHPVVRAFAADGAVRWRIELADYWQQQFRRSRDGRCCMYLIPDPRSGSYHIGEEVAVDGVGQVLVTLREAWAESRADQFQLRVLALESGFEVARDTLPGAVPFARGSSVVISAVEPFPQIVVRNWRPDVGSPKQGGGSGS